MTGWVVLWKAWSGWVVIGLRVRLGELRQHFLNKEGPTSKSSTLQIRKFGAALRTG